MLCKAQKVKGQRESEGESTFILGRACSGSFMFAGQMVYNAIDPKLLRSHRHCTLTRVVLAMHNGCYP